MSIQKIEISTRTIINTILILLAVLLIWQLRSIFVLLFLCFIFMEALNPAVTFLEKIKIPRSLAVIILYILVIGIVSTLVAGFVPIVVDQTVGFVKALPSLLKGLEKFNLPSSLKFFDGFTTNFTKTAYSIFSNLFSFLLILVITFYMLLERKNILQYVSQIFGQKGHDKTIDLMNKLDKSLGRWINAQLFLMLIISILSYIGYLLIGISYALPLAIIAGVLELIPNIGPTIAAILAAFVGLTISPLMAVFAIIIGIIVQQLEGNFIIPKVMKHAIGLRPIVTIIILIIGAKLGGLVGAVLALPIFLTAKAVYEVFFKK